MAVDRTGLLVLTSLLAMLTLVAVAPPVAGADWDDTLVNIVLFESDIKEALREISMQTGVAIVVDPNVTGTVTFDLVDVPLEKALRMILMGGGYAFKRVDDFYIVGLADTRSRIFSDFAEVEIYSFKNASAASAKLLIPAMFEPYVKFDTQCDIAVVAAPRELTTGILALLEKLDTPRAQVRVKALVTEVRTEAIKEWGLDSLDWDFSKGQVVKDDWTFLLGLAAGSFGITTDIFGAITAKVKALEKDKQAKIYADPVLLVADGKTADLFVGDRHNILPAAEGATLTRLEKVEAGAKLKVTPRIYGDHVEIAVEQKVSYFTDDSIYGPKVRAAEFGTSVRLAPGQTALIAGLTCEDFSSKECRTPILGDIPLVRLLFTKSVEQRIESELLIFLTAEVVK
ncbi:MAG: hypothetical protein GX872_06995 [Firmicutes bacterium]|nr:hypothetical protein [Bacillota bacterium]HXL05231.1 hypothetical protein [Bacillota bacterium]